MRDNVVQLRDVPSIRDNVDREEWQARVDLAAELIQPPDQCY